MKEPRRLTDPDHLKALAHPLRRLLFRQLSSYGPATVTALADRADADPGQVSYHLRELAKRGFIEEAPELARDRREHWWRAATETYAWSTADFDDPAGRAVAQTVERLQAEEQFQRLGAYQSVRSTWPEEWVAAAAAGSLGMRLTPDELRGLCAELAEVMTRWSERGKVAPQVRPEDRPEDGREHAYVFFYAFPERP